MRRLSIITVCMLLIALSIGHAAERKGQTGIGFRGSLFAPLMEGDQFRLNDRQFEPFMMGWGAGVDFSHALSNRFSVILSLGYVQTYDDTSATDNQSFSFFSSDNASVKLRGAQIGLMGMYHFMPEKKFQPYLLGGVGMDLWWFNDQIDDSDRRAQDVALKIGAGADYWLNDRLTLDFRGLFTYDVRNAERNLSDGYYGVADWQEFDYRPFRAHLQPSIGLTWHFGGSADEDKDGVSDDKDRCPGTPAGALVDRDGCPLDGDNDGVPDGLDKCENTPPGARVSADGCPIDSDGDGVFDGLDTCPDTPTGAEVDAKGCPLDGDGDGVPNYRDKQLDTPRGAEVDADGVAIDSDGDGVFNGLDACPGTPGDVEVDEKGCPKFVERLTTKITLNINYAPSSYEPDTPAKQTLDSLAEIMRVYPDTKVIVAGYTDSQGSEEMNLELSQKRAQGVVDYLISRGIDPGRMDTRGLGENPEYFIGDNNTAEGRRMNRRVEIESGQ